MHSRKPNTFVRVIRKFLLSAFVLLSFGAYALEHGGKSGAADSAPIARVVPPAGTPAETASPAAEAPPQAPPSTATSEAPAAPTDAPTQAPTDAPTAEPTAAPAPTTGPSSSGYRDGTYTGPSIDVQWGLVQVQATIKGGKISDVQFLQYPSDRRTSQRINMQADPWLQQEAIQVQSANVDLISGATLTSEGFAESLQGALDQARG